MRSERISIKVLTDDVKKNADGESVRAQDNRTWSNARLLGGEASDDWQPCHLTAVGFDQTEHPHN